MKKAFFHRLMSFSLVTSLFIAVMTSCSRDELSNASDRGSLLSGSSQAPVGTGANLDDLPATLSLSKEGDRLILSYQRHEGQRAPRTAEIFLSHPEGLELLEAIPGDALRLASKDLIVQAPKAGVLRIVIMSIGNLNTIDNGVLASLRFRGTTEALSEVLIQKKQSYFAPAEANLGVTLSPSDSANIANMAQTEE